MKGSKAIEKAKKAAAAARKGAAKARESAAAAVRKARTVAADERVKATGQAVLGGAASGLLTGAGIGSISILDPDGAGGDAGVVLPAGAIGGAALMLFAGKRPMIRGVASGMLAHAAGSLTEDLYDVFMAGKPAGGEA
jgi:hypothetical protein